MCGIFGCLGPIDAATLDALAAANQHRAGRGFGALVWNGTALHLERRLEPFHAEALPLEGARLVLVHLCAPTDGRADGAASLHPFETERLALAHNGILLNHRAFPSWRLGPVDSQVILGGVAEHLRAGHAPSAAIAETAGRLDGQQACWLFDKERGEVYLWRVIATLYLRPSAKDVRFSSARIDPSYELVPEGRVLRLDERGAEVVARFPFSSPFALAEGGQAP